jgi:hypothetical protein
MIKCAKTKWCEHNSFILSFSHFFVYFSFFLLHVNSSMENPPNEHHLPAELLKEIFLNIKDKKDLKNCLVVCKAWCFAAQGFFSNDIRIRMNDRSLKKLYTDLQAFPAISQKVKYITFHQLSSGAENPATLRSALSLCPNLAALQFDIVDVYDYLKAMNCHEMMLPSIQKIRISDLNSCSPAVRRFHLWVNYRFRATITSLEIADLENNGALKNYGGLIKLVAQFPNLTYLRAKCHSIAERQLNVNLTALIQNCPKLQELKLYGIGRITNDVKDIPDSEPTQFPNLTKLKLKVSQINIKSLQYIVTRFKNVKNLRLITFNVVPDTSLTSSQADNILGEFTEYSKSFERININYKYKNQNFFTNHGKKRPTWSSNIMMMVGLPEEFLQEEWMDDEWIPGDDDVLDDEDYEDYLEDEDLIEELAGDALGNMLYEAHLASMLYQRHLTHHHGNDEDEEGDDDYEGLPDGIGLDAEDEDFLRDYYSLD